MGFSRKLSSSLYCGWISPIVALCLAALTIGKAAGSEAPKRALTPAEIQEKIRFVNISDLTGIDAIEEYMCTALCTYNCLRQKEGNWDYCTTICYSMLNDSRTLISPCDLRNDSCLDQPKCKQLIATNVTVEKFNDFENITAAEVPRDPYLINVTWAPVDDAEVYLVVWKERKNNISYAWNAASKLFNHPFYRFRKPTLCSIFKFSFGVIRSPNHIEWSNGSALRWPTPVMSDSDAGYQLVDMHYTSKGIIVDIQFNFPTGWTKYDFKEWKISVKSPDCANLPKSTYLNSESVPISLLFDRRYYEMGCNVSFSVEQLETLCNTTLDYPKSTTLPLEFNCENVRNSPCVPETEARQNQSTTRVQKCEIPFDCALAHFNLSISAASNLEADDSVESCVNGVANILVNWSKPFLSLHPRCSSPHHYMLWYGYGLPKNKSEIVMLDMIRTRGSQSQQLFSMPILLYEVGPTYYFSVCAIFEQRRGATSLQVPEWKEHYDPVMTYRYKSALYCDMIKAQLKQHKEGHKHSHRLGAFESETASSKEETHGDRNKSLSASSEERLATQLEIGRQRIASILSPVVLMIVFVCVIVVIFHVRRRRKRAKRAKQLRDQNMPPAAAMLNQPQNDYYNNRKRSTSLSFVSWELPRSRLVVFDFEKALGSGAFGEVYKGKVLSEQHLVGGGVVHSVNMAKARKTSMDAGFVAVKQCFDYADEGTKSEFRREIELMQNLGYHPHLVNMLYKITLTEPLSLIVEYCENGDLRHFLRDIRKYMLDLERMGINILDQNAPLDGVDDQRIFSLRDVFLSAFQVADGLEYLHQKNYVHCDIAARNILVDKARKCKIGDFGLCRYVNRDSQAYMRRAGKVPIKWMSLETLQEFSFTRENDVWSFGVLLFEIITLGGTPYPDVLPYDGDFQKAMIDYLRSGRRMEPPDNCPQELYRLMLHCWSEDPDDRPTATSARETLRMMVETLANQNQEIYLDPTRDYYNAKDSPAEDDSEETGPGAFQGAINCHPRHTRSTSNSSPFGTPYKATLDMLPSTSSLISQANSNAMVGSRGIQYITPLALPGNKIYRRISDCSSGFGEISLSPTSAGNSSCPPDSANSFSSGYVSPLSIISLPPAVPEGIVMTSEQFGPPREVPQRQLSTELQTFTTPVIVVQPVYASVCDIVSPHQQQPHRQTHTRLPSLPVQTPIIASSSPSLQKKHFLPSLASIPAPNQPNGLIVPTLVQDGSSTPVSPAATPTVVRRDKLVKRKSL